MYKRGDFTANWLFYFVAVVVLIMVFFFGGKSFNDIKDTGCAAETMLLVQQMTADAEEISYEQGSVVDKEYAVSCGADRLYFVDSLISPASALFMQVLEPLPIVREEIKSRTGRNVFFYSGNEMVDGVEITQLALGLPYYRC